VSCGKADHSFHERDLAVAAVVGFGAVHSVSLEVAVRGMTSAAECEIGTAYAALSNAALVLVDPCRPYPGSDELVQRSAEHVAAGKIAVAVRAEPGQFRRDQRDLTVPRDGR
jgi:hypothetical protein